MAIGHYEDKFSLTNSGLPAVGAVYTVKNTGTSTLSTLTNAAGTPTGSSTFITDSRGNGGFYASDTLGYDIYDGGGTLILTDIRVVDIGAGGGALSYSSSTPVDTTTGTAAVGTSTTGAPHADHSHHIGAHATTHNSGGSDATTLAESQVTGLVADLASKAALAGSTTQAFSALDLAIAGLTGAATTSRYVGATASGAPASGTFNTGDWALDLTGTLWICTAGGSPGTWIQTTASFATTAGSATTAGPPTGTAGGDLSGSYPNPTVAQATGTFLAKGSPPFKLPTGTTGYVLTSDAGGNLILAPPAGGAGKSYSTRIHADRMFR